MRSYCPDMMINDYNVQHIILRTVTSGAFGKNGGAKMMTTNDFIAVDRNSASHRIIKFPLGK